MKATDRYIASPLSSVVFQCSSNSVMAGSAACAKQQHNSVIQGIANDASGAPIPGAHVIVRNQDTGAERATALMRAVISQSVVYRLERTQFG